MTEKVIKYIAAHKAIKLCGKYLILELKNSKRRRNENIENIKTGRMPSPY